MRDERADDEGAAAVLPLAGIVLGVGLADSLNPSTAGAALYLATTRGRPLAWRCSRSACSR